MTYFKIFAISVFSSLLFLSVFVMVAFDSENTLSKAYEHFVNKQYYEARNLLTNEDIHIPLTDFYLYEAYLAREELGLKKSQRYLLQALEELSVKKSSTALETTLNLAFDAFLQKDLNALQTAIVQSQQYAVQDEPWVHFFMGCHAYLNQDYPQALKSWEAGKSRRWLSNWMKTSFENHFSTEDRELKSLHAEIESGQLCSARKILEQHFLTFPESYHDDINFLLALSYIKECDDLPFEKRSATYQKSIEILNEVPANNSYYVQEKNRVFNIFKKQIVQEISNHHFANLPLYVNAFENWKSHKQIELLSDDLASLFNEKIMIGSDDAVIIIQGLSKELPEREFKQKLTIKLTRKIHEAITKGNLQYLEKYMVLCQKFLFAQNHNYSVLADAAASKILESVESDNAKFEKSMAYIAFWKALEKNPHNRYLLGQQLVHKAQCVWSINGDAQKAIELIKMAELLPFKTEQNLLHEDIERAVVKTYRQAVLQDHVHEFPFFQIAVKEFHLNDTEILDDTEIANQLADAEYLFNIGRYTLASTKACWVLQNTPEDQIARKIAAMTAYEEGHYSEVVEHVKHLKTMDASVQEALAVSQVLTGGTLEGSIALQTLADQQFLSDEAILRLGFGNLILSRPDNSKFWLNKIRHINDEVFTGFYIAAFQKQDWNTVIKLYNQLSALYKQAPAIQGMVIQAYVAQNQCNQADEIFLSFLSTKSGANLQDVSKPFLQFQKYLNHFDVNDFAARYFLYVKKDPENALERFNAIKNPTPEILLERAELAYSLKNYSESIQDLKKSLESSKRSVHEKALTLLGNIYLELGFYPDSVHHFKELFSLNPVQNLTIHQSYCQALIAIGLNNFAAPHFQFLGMQEPVPLGTPQELGTPPGPDIATHRRLKSLEFQLSQYPNSISPQILLCKELLRYSEEANNPSNELLLSYEMLEILNKKYSFIPEAWLLQGQVLARLNCNPSAKKAFAHAIALSPQYAEAYKQLALINILEKDFFVATYNLKQALQIAPNDMEAWNLLAKLEEQLQMNLARLK